MKAKVVQAIYTFMYLSNHLGRESTCDKIATNISAMADEFANESIFAVLYQLIIGSIWIYYLASVVP